MPLTLAASALVTTLAVLFVFVALLMILIVLIQKPKGGGLSGAFGGAGGSEGAFMGAKAGDFLTWLTVGCFVFFLLFAMMLTWTINPTQNIARNQALQPAGNTQGSTNTDSPPGAADANPSVPSTETAGESTPENE